jgi:hypothetical protein
MDFRVAAAGWPAAADWLAAGEELLLQPLRAIRPRRISAVADLQAKITPRAGRVTGSLVIMIPIDCEFIPGAGY